MVNLNQPVSDSPGFSEFLTQNHIPNAVTIDPTFAHLNGRAIGRASVNRTTIKEKLAIATVTFASNAAYKGGGMLTDFTTIGAISRFSSVYLVSIQNKTNALYTNFIADVNNAPNLGKIKFYDNTGTELVDGSLAIQNVILKCIVRGA
ncbi:MAG: hypothetical protein KGH87_08585 [Thaumarchaeota archaeon]|nr:hypothetical protein [Nitrososphaerota archaeon]